MNTRLCISVAGLILAGVFVSAVVEADVAWTGPGWYVEATSMGFDYTLYSGPYADEATCNANKPADNNDYGYVCLYEQTDGGGAR